MLWLTALPAVAGGPPVTGIPSVPILVYHRFDPAQAAFTTVTTPVFEAQMEWLLAHHYRVLPLRDLPAWLRSQHDERAVVLTADDGHRSVYTQMFPVLQRLHLPVTLFIYPSAISNASYALTWQQLREMQQSGQVDIESHTYWHPNFRTEQRRLSPKEYEAFVAYQLVGSKQKLEQQMGWPVTALAWPYGIFDRQLEQAAAKAGYHYAFAYAGGAARPGSDPYAIPRIPVSNSDQGAAFEALLTGTASAATRRAHG
jgi:peptidoglycan/xylan/chitin deacetylase (PgdA/CDA1 family)